VKETVLVVAAHPDGETLGCGATLLRHAHRGDTLFWCIVTAISEQYGWPRKNVKKREREIQAVSDHYGFEGVYQLGMPTARLDEQSLGDLVEALGDVVRDVKPTTIYLPFPGDVHSDHRTVFDAGYSAAKWFRYPSVKRVLVMEIPSETDFAPPFAKAVFSPNVFIDVSNHFQGKLEAMQLYAGELGEHPFPRSEQGIKALATLRGAACGCEYVEAFMLLKELQR